MSYIDRNGVKQPSGALYVNDKKSSSAPDYSGDMELSHETIADIRQQLSAGNDMPKIRIAGWKKQGQKGTFISMKAEPSKKESASAPSAPVSSVPVAPQPPQGNSGDEIPF